jgi:hypothetical protein
LRAPPWKTVLQWGRQLRMNPTDIQTVSDRLSLRHALGKIILYLKKKPISFKKLFQVPIRETFQIVECGKKQHRHRSVPRFLLKET